ncbi:hypothetical protein AVEN_257573-1 [Araneus ventricosus]|uniref:Uncharacterized protein n=1 Tax=Araneus ventricosus TaxID=182803 RepID=A0A4Y2SXL7_ARAVE|nr:hypothetical protein AVEN_257573-1 [Araneus ventricosus]
MRPGLLRSYLRVQLCPKKWVPPTLDCHRVNMDSLLSSPYVCTCLNETKPLKDLTYESNCAKQAPTLDCHRVNMNSLLPSPYV